MGRVRFTSHIKEWTNQKERDADIAVLEMVTDIHRVASVFAPKDKRILVNSGRIFRKGQAHYAVVFGGGGVHYALRRHFENKKNPGSLRYLERAGDSIGRNIRRYTRGMSA